MAVRASFIFMPMPLPLGEVDLRSKDGEGEDANFLAFHFTFLKNCAIIEPVFSGFCNRALLGKRGRKNHTKRGKML